MIKHKALSGVKVEDEAQGMVSAVFSKFNVVDLDGDVTLPGAFKNGQEVRISAYGHASHFDALPVGRGKIRTTEDEAIMDGQFFLGTQAGRDTFEVVKQMGKLQEWSYGYDVLKAAPGEFEGKEVQFLKKLKVIEVSPVLQGAGIGTRTLVAKSLGVDMEELVEALASHLKSDPDFIRSITKIEESGDLKAQEPTRVTEPQVAEQEPTRATKATTKDHLTLLLRLQELEAS